MSAVWQDCGRSVSNQEERTNNRLHAVLSQLQMKGITLQGQLFCWQPLTIAKSAGRYAPDYYACWVVGEKMARK